jgi:hypothetical protein
MGSDGRDTSIQIFDRFVSLSFAENEEVLLDITFICFAAVSSILIASKVHEGQSLLTMANFPHFGKSDLIEFERMLLGKINYQIMPLCTPSSFARHLLGLCPEHADIHLEIIRQVDKHIADFSEQPSYSAFSPCTVAISALLISFACWRIQCTSWLSRIPSICLPRAGNPYYIDNLINIDLCLTCLQRIESVEKLSEVSAPQTPDKSAANKAGSSSASSSSSPTGVNAVLKVSDASVDRFSASVGSAACEPDRLASDAEVLLDAGTSTGSAADAGAAAAAPSATSSRSKAARDELDREDGIDLEAMEEDAVDECRPSSLKRPKASSATPYQYDFSYIY